MAERPTVATAPVAQRLRARLRSFGALQWALALSVAAHAGLLLMNVAAPQFSERVFRDTPLEVILVNARSSQRPTQAQAIAQATLAGGGEAAAGRATTPLPPSLEAESGEHSDNARAQVERMQQQQQQLLARLQKEVATLTAHDPQPEGQLDTRAQEERRRQMLQTLGEIETRINEENERPRRRYISPATKEAVYAVYYDALRRRVEERGTRDFPTHQGRKLYGELTMNITIDAQGRLVDATVVRASGSKPLDQRAISIVQAAAPFGRFGEQMRRQADQIVVTSRFRFTRESGLSTTLSGR